MARKQKYAVTLQSFLNTDGTVLAVSANTFEAIVDSKEEASVIIAMAYNDAGSFFSQFAGFDVDGLPKSPYEPEMHIVIRIGEAVICKFDAVPVKASKARLPAADSFVVPGTAALN